MTGFTLNDLKLTMNAHIKLNYQIMTRHGHKTARVAHDLSSLVHNKIGKEIILSSHHHFQPSNNYFPVSFNIPVFVWKK